MDDLGQEGHATGGSDGIASNLERVLMFLFAHENSHCMHEGSTEGTKMRIFVTSPSSES